MENFSDLSLENQKSSHEQSSISNENNNELLTDNKRVEDIRVEINQDSIKSNHKQYEEIDVTLMNIKQLLHESKYLKAVQLWETIKDDCNKLFDEGATENYILVSNEENNLVESISQRYKNEYKPLISVMLQRSEDIRDAINRANLDMDSEWLHGMTLFGITTHYKVDSDGIIHIRLEGTLEDLPIFEQVAVIHEIDLFTTWLPFCHDSVLLEKIGPVEIVSYLYFSAMGLSRDTLLSGYAADVLDEEKKIIILVNSIPSKEGIEVPFRKVGWLHRRFEVLELTAVVNIISPKCAKTIITTKVNLNIPALPQRLLNFVIKKVAGVLLYVFQNETIKVAKDKHCEHNNRIRNNKYFYSEWVLPKLKDICLKNNWEEPKITAFEDDDDIKNGSVESTTLDQIKT